ncbi:MAG TPA: translation elongation factor Ts, partial [Myxococcales bacterium]|nr:translation elongation factor Ts [Myxococcales bacterium]
KEDLAAEVEKTIAAASPLYVRREEVPSDVLEKEKEIQRQQLRDQKKPEQMIEKILEGKLGKYYETVCLLDQFWVKDDKKRISELITEKIAKIGENISVRRFVRYQVGEGIEKKKEDLAAEVEKTIAAAKS